MNLSLDQARQIIAATREEAARSAFKPMTVVVLDAGGHMIAADREDGSANGRFQIAFGKAHGALALGMGSRSLMERAEQQAYFIAAAASAVGGSLVPVPGGVLVRDGATLVGAVGVSGDTSDNDESVAVAGIRAAGLVAQPD